MDLHDGRTFPPLSPPGTAGALAAALLGLAILVGLVEAGQGVKTAGKGLPMTGKEVPDLAAFDSAMQTFMRERGIPAGTLAVMKEGQLVLSRGYGHADAKKTRALGPDAPLRVASVSKPITAAAVLKLIRQGKLRLDTRVFPFLAVTPPQGRAASPRLQVITVEHLLKHQGGWDSKATFDPMFQPLKVAAALGKPGPATAADVVRYMAGQPLQFEPGSKTAYSNFGYCVLGRVIEKASGRRYTEYVQKELLGPLGIRSVELGRSLPADRNPREPFYADPDSGPNVLRPQAGETVPAPDGTFYLEAMDSHGGLIASAPDLVRFQQAYLADGQPRPADGESSAVVFGSLPGTWSMALWHGDVNVAVLFNQRTDPSGLPYQAISDVMRDTADGITRWPAAAGG